MLKAKKVSGYCVVPTAVLRDTNLSLQAKALLMWVYDRCANNKNYDDDSILENNKITKKELSKILEELSSAGYTTVDRKTGEIELAYSARKKAESLSVDSSEIHTTKEKEEKGEKKERLNLYQKCEKAVLEYTEDKALQNELLIYLQMRLNPAKGSNLDDKRLSGAAQWYRQLHTLDDMVADKVKIVQQSIERGWAKFVDLQPNAGVEVSVIESSRYTKEEQEEIQRRIEKLKESGERTSY